MLTNVDQLLDGDTVVLRVLLVEVEGDRLVLVLIKKLYVNFLIEFNPYVRASLHLPFFCTDISENFKTGGQGFLFDTNEGKIMQKPFFKIRARLKISGKSGSNFRRWSLKGYMAQLSNGVLCFCQMVSVSNFQSLKKRGEILDGRSLDRKSP